MLRLLLRCSLLVVLAACGGETDRRTSAVRADSAGIEIVTSAAPAWRDGEGWRIDPVPALEIAPRSDDDPRYDFLRVNSGTILPGGEVAVLVAGSSEIRFFSASGEWLRSAGRAGDGPGEMRTGAGLLQAGDTLYMRDAILRRVSAFDHRGTFLASWPWPVAEGFSQIQPVHRLANGDWIATAGFSTGSSAPFPATNEIVRSPVAWMRIAPGFTGVRDTIAVGESAERYMQVSMSGGVIQSVSIIAPLFSRSTQTAVGGDRFVWGDNASPELRIHDAGGALRRILRWNTPAIPITPELLGRMKQEELANASTPQAREGIESRYTSIPIAATEVPWFSGIQLADDGHLWLREFPTLRADPVRFQVFDAEGEYLGRLELPPKHTVLEVGREHLLTVWRDDDDLEYVRVYRLDRKPVSQ